LKTSSHIGHVTELVELIQKSAIPADRVVARFFIERRYLGARDRRIISDISYGVLRHAYRIERLLRETLGQLHLDFPPVYPKLWLVAAYKTGIMNDSAEKVVDDIGAQWNMAGAGIDLLLLCRGIEQQKDLKFASGDPVERLCVQYSFPQWMVEDWIAHYGYDETEKLCHASHLQAPLTLRVNTLRTTVDECVKRLAGEGIEATRTVYSPLGLVVPKRINFSALMSYRDGLYEIQDEGSQIVSLLANPQPSDIVVDACAGGGGKTLHLAALMQNQGIIYALDIGDQRLKEMVRRSRRSGVTIIVPRVVAADTPVAEDLSLAADCVLIDAPCSGSGTIRRNPFLKWRITQDGISNYVAMQGELLRRYSRCAKVGGTVVYATCSLFRSENDDVLKEFLVGHPEFVVQKSRSILDRWGIGDLGSDDAVQLLPSKHGTDGFYAVALRRRRL
jgi:16S rRNA (cytosine967-C5)-methyltransferase